MGPTARKDDEPQRQNHYTGGPEPDGEIGHVYRLISAPVGDAIDFALAVDGLVAATSGSLREVSIPPFVGGIV